MRGTPSAGADGGLPHFPLRVSRINPGQQRIARTLSPRVFGLFTHWVRHRSVYCEPDACCPAVHRFPRYWKGYCGVELYNQADQLWEPTVLEVTEHLELCFRHLYKRGQIWELWRLPAGKKKHEPVEGRLLEQLEETQVPAAFSIVECLLHLYHVDVINLDAKNPLPDVVLVQATRADRPPVVAPPRQLEEQLNEEQRRANAELLKKFMSRGKAPDPAAEASGQVPHLNGKPKS